MSRLSSFLAAVSLGLAAPLACAQSDAEATLATLIGEYEQLIRQDDPISAGQEGDREALRRLPDVRPQTQLTVRTQLKAIVERLERIDASRLPDEAALNHL